MNTTNTPLCDSMQHLVVDALFGEISPEAKTTLDIHLNECSSCALMMEEMQRTLEMTRDASDAPLPDAYWVGFQQKLDARIATQHKPIRMGRWIAHLHRVLDSAGRPSPALAYRGGIAVLLIAIGVLIGRYGFSGASSTTPVAVEVESESLSMQMAALTESYLNRSSILLLGLVNHDVEHDGTLALSFDRKQEVAGVLVQEAALLKASLHQSKETQLVMLIEELEKILLQIANLELQEDMPGIEMIQQGIEGQALLLKINLETMKLMDKPIPVPSQELTL